MTDEFDERLRLRLNALEVAVPVPAERSLALREAPAHRPAWKGLSVGGLASLAIGLVIVLVIGAAYGLGPKGGPPQTPVCRTELPSGGISCDRAIELARQAGGSRGTLVKAEAGPFVDVYPGDTSEPPAANVQLDRLVWRVTFRTTMLPRCPKPPGATWTLYTSPYPAENPTGTPICGPHAATLDVYLDYYTGEFMLGEETTLAG